MPHPGPTGLENLGVEPSYLYLISLTGDSDSRKRGGAHAGGPESTLRNTVQTTNTWFT